MYKDMLQNGLSGGGVETTNEWINIITLFAGFVNMFVNSMQVSFRECFVNI